MPTQRFRALVFAPSLAALLLITAPKAPAGPITMGGVLPGGGMIHKQVESIQERKFSDLVKQRTDFSCGAASLATILRYAYERDTGETDVLEGLFEVTDAEQVRRRGFSLLDIKNYVQTVGLRGRGYQVNEEGLDSISIPTIVLLDIDGYKHFVVLKKVDGQYAYIGDPALGNRVMDRDEFINGWNGVVFAVIGPNFDRNTVLLQPRGKMTARHLNDVYTPVPKTRLLDFGFNHADLF